MARKKKGEGEGEELLTLSEVGERTGISMPSLLRYKKEHQDRIPAVGEGRTQRYPVEALEVFEEIKRENLSKRGRPKGSGGGAKKAAAGGRKAGRPARAGRKAAGDGGGRGGRAAAPAAGEGDGEELLTLTHIAAQTGISYPTLRNYAERHGDRIPSVGEGRKRRYRPEAVEVFKELRAESRPGRKPAGGGATRGGGKRAAAATSGGGRAAAKAAGDGADSGELARRVADLAGRQERLQRDLERVQAILEKPAEATVRWR